MGAVAILECPRIHFINNNKVIIIIIVIVMFRSFLLTVFCCVQACVGELNDRPIIGIVSQTIHPELDAILPPGHNYTTYIASSYIKWVEAAGARAVPVIVENEITSEEYYLKLFSGLNGLLIPGGAVSIFDGGYAEASNWFFEKAKEVTIAMVPKTAILYSRRMLGVRCSQSGAPAWG